MDEKERQEFDLDDIIREFGSHPEEQPEAPEETAEPEALEDFPEEAYQELLHVQPPAQENAEELEATRRLDPVDTPAPENTDLEATRRLDPVQPASDTEVTGDTIRLDGLRSHISQLVREQTAEEEVEARIWNPAEKPRSEPFSDQWEPEYEQPIGEYIPPQPIQFHPRSRLHELKRKLVAGPEKRFYELSEQGIGKLQSAIFLSMLVALISAASTAMYAFGLVEENRLRLMVFGQFLALLVSALLGSFQLIEGLADLRKKRFTLNTMLCITFVMCCIDGALCLHQVRVPCCAAFSLAVTMSLWSAYQRRNTELSQLDTMRKAIRLDGITACYDYLDGKTGFLRKEGQVEDFMDHYNGPVKPETTLNVYSLVATILAFIIGIVAAVLFGIAAGVQVTAVSLLAAVPATAFIAHSRPMWILERRLHRLGTVLCGWQGVEGLRGKAVFPVTFDDLFPADTVRLNGVKYFGSREPDVVIAYASAVITADNSGLSNLFAHILDRHNGRHYDAYNLLNYENGGVGGIVEGEAVLIGSYSFMKEMEIPMPENAKVSYGVYVAIEGELSGLFAVSYEKTQSAAAGLSTLSTYRRLQCAVASNDFMLTQGFLKNKFGINPKRILLPEYPVRAQLQEKQESADGQVLLMTTALGLAPLAYGVTGARALRTTCRMGTVLHIVGGAVGLAIMILLVVLGALELLTPANMFLYQLVWMIPALLFTEWTRSI